MFIKNSYIYIYIYILSQKFFLQQSRWPRGKILGGTSRLNFMAYVLGHQLDYEKWFPDFAGIYGLIYFKVNLEKKREILICTLIFSCI